MSRLTLLSVIVCSLITGYAAEPPEEEFKLHPFDVTEYSVEEVFPEFEAGWSRSEHDQPILWVKFKASPRLGQKHVPTRFMGLRVEMERESFDASDASKGTLFLYHKPWDGEKIFHARLELPEKEVEFLLNRIADSAVFSLCGDDRGLVKSVGSGRSLRAHLKGFGVEKQNLLDEGRGAPQRIIGALVDELVASKVLAD